MRLLFTVFFTGVCILSLNAQQQDFQLRSGIQVNANLPKRFSASVQYQFRADQNATHFRGSYISGALQYEVIKNVLTAEGEYRYRTSYNANQHRLGVGFTAKIKKGNFGFSYRTRYQQRYPYFNGGVYEPGKEPSAFWRNRLQVKYKLKKKLDLYASAEFFYKVTVGESYPGRMRYLAGMEWELKKNQHLTLFYMVQQQYNATNPLRVYALGINYAYDLPRFGKKKSKKEEDYF